MSGKNRKITSLVDPIMQKVFVKWMVPRIPKWIETYHLTLLTIPFSLLIILTGRYARMNSYFLFAHALIVLLQYISDVLDGSLGRHRNTGLVRWGFFMDHFLDFVFANSIMFSYAQAFGISIETSAILLVLIGGFFMLEFIISNIRGMVNVYGYYGIGPTEARLGIVLFDIYLGVTRQYPSSFVVNVLTGAICLILALLVISTQKSLWQQDMKSKLG